MDDSKRRLKALLVTRSCTYCEWYRPVQDKVWGCANPEAKGDSHAGKCPYWEKWSQLDNYYTVEVEGDKHD